MDRVIDEYKKLLKLESFSAREIKHEDNMVSQVFLLEAKNAKPLILKIYEHTSHYIRELYFLPRLNNIIPTPQIIDKIPPGGGLHCAILMEYLPGEILTSKKITKDIAYEAGNLLAQVHSNKGNEFGDVARQDLFGMSAIPSFKEKFQENLNECKNHLADDVIDKCITYYNAHNTLLNDVDGPCIVHLDFRPGNLLVQNGKIQGIIDWASARYGFAEEDFCPIEIGEWAMSVDCKSAFVSGYSQVRPIPQYESIMPLLRVNKALGIIGFALKRGTWNNINESLYKMNLEFISSLFDLK